MSYPTSEPHLPPEENTGYGWQAPTSPAPPGPPEPPPPPSTPPSDPVPTAVPSTVGAPPPVWMPPPPLPGSVAPARFPIALVAFALAVVIVAGCALMGWLLFAPSHQSHTSAYATSQATSQASAGPSPSPNASGRLTNRAYGDWNFRWGDVTLNATKTGGRDFSTCAPAERDSWLTEHGCGYGIELDYSAEHGAIRFEHLILVFDSTAHASTADKQLTEDDARFNTAALNDPHKVAYWARDKTDEYLVITACTASRADLEDKVRTYLHYANADETAALMFRD